MKKGKTHAFSKRKWLNPVTAFSSGTLYYGVRVDTYKDLAEEGVTEEFVDVYMDIMDCYRKISLELDTGTKRDRARSVKKLQLIADACDELSEWIQTHRWKE